MGVTMMLDSPSTFNTEPEMCGKTHSGEPDVHIGSRIKQRNLFSLVGCRNAEKPEPKAGGPCYRSPRACHSERAKPTTR
jgi:hypothetical protein